MALSKETKNHEEIRRWAKARNAIPSEVASTHSDNESGILRFQFPQAPNQNNSSLKELSWEDFFEKFDDADLTFVYQEKTKDGQKSNFNKLIQGHDQSGSSDSAHERS